MWHARGSLGTQGKKIRGRCLWAVSFRSTKEGEKSITFRKSLSSDLFCDIRKCRDHGDLEQERRDECAAQHFELSESLQSQHKVVRQPLYPGIPLLWPGRPAVQHDTGDREPPQLLTPMFLIRDSLRKAHLFICRFSTNITGRKPSSTSEDNSHGNKIMG